MINRRDFLKVTSLGSAVFLGAPWSWKRAEAALAIDGSPIREISTFDSRDFNGDDITRPHQALWNTEAYIAGKGGLPARTGSCRFAVIGGGAAGLVAAYRLREYQPLLIEQDSQLGGNSKGERFQGQSFSIGAAYITPPGEEIARLFEELGIAGELKTELSADSRVIAEKGVRNFWADHQDIENELRRIFENEYPEIPPKTGQDFSALDRTTAYEWLKSKTTNTEVIEYFQLYCWSSFGGSLEELSAAQFLNFAAAEVEGVCAFPGGNARITEALASALARSLPRDRLRTLSMVLEVREVADGVEILFENSRGALELWRVDGCVVAAPKYVARFILKDLPRERSEQWRSLPYRAYVVANVLMDDHPAPAFDLFCLKGKVPAMPSFGSRTDRPLTDVVASSWASGGGPSVLTVYRPFPFEGSRNLLMGPSAQERLRKEISEELTREVLPALGYSGPDSIRGLRLTRWGHAIPLARAGLMADSLAAPIGRPLGSRIYFANQDNWMNPSFESAFASACEATDALKKMNL